MSFETKPIPGDVCQVPSVVGTSVDLVATDAPDAAGYDVAHVFGIFEPATARRQIDALRGGRTPIVLSPIWLDLRDPDQEDLGVLSDEFGLHPLAVEDAGNEKQRPKLDRYRTHLFLTAYAVKLDTATGQLAASEVDAFITDRALITIHRTLTVFP